MNEPAAERTRAQRLLVLGAVLLLVGAYAPIQDGRLGLEWPRCHLPANVRPVPAFLMAWMPALLGLIRSY